MAKVSIIAAIASGNRALGKNNKLIYQIPEDLQRFRKITSNHPIIMGRKTFESIGRILPNRTNIIISRNPNYIVEGGKVAGSLEDALRQVYPERSRKTQGENEIFIIGGGQIYQEAIKLADKLYLTVVEGNPQADTFFPEYSEFKKIVFEENHEKEGLKYKFLDLER